MNDEVQKVELILETERLRLRPLLEADLDLGLELLTDPAVMNLVTGPMTAEEVKAEMPDAVRRCAGGAVGIWCVENKVSGEKLGTGILLPLPIEAEDTEWDLIARDDISEREIEVGYLLKPAAWGQGYATEVCRRLLRFAFEATDWPQVVAVTDPKHHASGKVLLKSGMTAEGLRHAYATEVLGYRITREAWLGRRE